MYDIVIFHFGNRGIEYRELAVTKVWGSPIESSILGIHGAIRPVLQYVAMFKETFNPGKRSKSAPHLL